MDICTAIVVTTMTTQACWTENHCYPSEDGTKQICSGVRPAACPIRNPGYSCKRADGTEYWWEGPFLPVGGQK